MSIETQSALTEGRIGERRVGILIPLALDRPYDYLVPEGLALLPGDFVRVPLGRRQVVGIVWGVAAGDIEAARLKPVALRLALPALPEISRRFVDWVANYTMSPAGAVLRMAMSVPEALEPERPVRVWKPGDAALANITAPRKRVLERVLSGPPLATTELARLAGVSPAIVAAMGKQGLIRASEQTPQARFPTPDPLHAGALLSAAQESAAAELRRLAPGTTLLDGVTGSGKTEVYFEAIAACLQKNRQALVLVPEIALTAQWLQRFEARFGVLPAQWHSDLTARERRLTWRAVLSGEARVVIGARSALFLPFPDLGLVVVDEEHESAFKQEEGIIYQARDMAVVRGHLAKIPVVLASATPSLETLTNVETGRYQSLQLPERHGGASLPEISLVDLRSDPPGRQSWLSPSLVGALRKTLGEGEQALLFLNRRGYAPLTLCRVCGHRLQCPRCTAWLVEHRFKGRLLCHHCGFEAREPRQCPACAAEGKFAACGPGVERLAEEAALLFPDARRLMLTSDTVTGPAKAAELLRQVAEREVDLVIGTQIIAKGHNFPHLTLVGIVDADLGLQGGDLRAVERTYQLLHQVSGRAGRGERKGRVLVQTYDPARAVMRALASGERAAFLAAESADRRENGLPPFGRLAALILSGAKETALDAKANEMARAAPHLDGVTILGPAPAPLALLRGRHRRRFLIKTRRDIAPQPIIKAWLAGLKFPGDLRLQIDIDPYSFL
jgi:primosomal protein N' (replication factor Y) (superfamily II helicase)